MPYIAKKSGTEERVHVSEAEKGTFYKCIICGNDMFLKKGDIKAPHFAHRKNGENYSICTDSWSYDHSQWRYQFQNRFSKQFQEIVLENSASQRRIADIFVQNIVIELQHNLISYKEFCERNEYFSDFGFKVIWVFDMSEEFSQNLIKKEQEEGKYRLSECSKSKLLRRLTTKSDIYQIYFADNEDNIFRLSNSYKEFEVVYSDSKRVFKIDDFVRTAENSPESLLYVPKSVPQPLSSLWSNNLKSVVVTNTETGQDFYIKTDEKGQFQTYNNKKDGLIVGKYTTLKDGEIKYSAKEYIIKDQQKPVWTLKLAKHRQ